MLDDRLMSFLAIARACARVRGAAIEMLNDTDLSVVYCVAKEHPNPLTHQEICEMVNEREQTYVFRSLQRMTERGVLAASKHPIPCTHRKITRYTLGPQAEGQIRFWADQFDACVDGVI